MLFYSMHLLLSILILGGQWTEYCQKYAKPEDIGASQEEISSDDEPSEDDYASSDDAIAGQPDP